jgi:hypothetical protein
LAGDGATHQKAWPKTPRGLAGLLRSLAPALRATGVEILFDLREGKNRDRLIRLASADRPLPQDGVSGPSASSASSAPFGPGAAAQDGLSVGLNGLVGGAGGWTTVADGADGPGGTDSVGMGEHQSDEWGEV